MDLKGSFEAKKQLSEYGHVVYQYTDNGMFMYNNMQANILPLHTLHHR